MSTNSSIVHSQGVNTDATVSGIAATLLLLRVRLYAAGPQPMAEPEPSGAAQVQAAAIAEPAQRQGTKVSQKKVDQVKVGLHSLSSLALPHLHGLCFSCCITTSPCTAQSNTAVKDCMMFVNAEMASLLVCRRCLCKGCARRRQQARQLAPQLSPAKLACHRRTCCHGTLIRWLTGDHISHTLLDSLVRCQLVLIILAFPDSGAI